MADLVQLERHVGLYEVLARFDFENADGGGKTVFTGAHARDKVRFINVETGKVDRDEEQPARPITREEFGALLGDNSAKLIEAADLATLRANVAEARVTELEAEMAEEQAARALAEQKLASIAALLA